MNCLRYVKSPNTIVYYIGIYTWPQARPQARPQASSSAFICVYMYCNVMHQNEGRFMTVLTLAGYP